MAVFVRRWVRIPKVAKEKGSEEILWVELEGTVTKIYVAVVYFVQKESTRYEANADVRMELEEDIIEFRSRGMVVLIGDVNSRIGECMPQEGVREGKKRKNKDKKINENGREWIQMMRRTGMLMLTGLYGTADFTCYNVQGNSVVDHICIDRENSYKVRGIESKREVMGRINTDHSMVVVSLKIVKSSEEQKESGDVWVNVKPKKVREKPLSRIKKGGVGKIQEEM